MDSEYKYRGCGLEKLKEMSIEDLANLFKSKIRRKIKRGFSDEEKKLIEKINSGKRKLKTHCRDMVVLPSMVGKRIEVYNGKAFTPINIIEEMIGYRLGEFAPTRKIGVKHGGKQDATKKGKSGGKN